MDAIASPPQHAGQHRSRRYFEASPAAWADLPADVLRAIARAAADDGDSGGAIRFAGVCKGWRWLLDDPDLRRALKFASPATDRARLLAALRSLALFVCSRAPVTRELVFAVRLPADHPSGAHVAAALAPVLTHLAGELEGVTLQHATASLVLASSPFLDVCARLAYLHCTVPADLDLWGVSSLALADLVIDSPAVRRLWLPDHLVSLRVRVMGEADPAVLDSLLGELRYMHRLVTFKLWTEHTYAVDVASLPPTLTTLSIGGPVYLDAQLPPAATMPGLEVLSLASCRLSAARLARFVHGCTKLRALGLVDYLVDDLPGQVVDARHLPLRAAALVTGRVSCHMTVLLPPTVRVLAAGHEDLYVLLQPGVCDGLRVLKLPHTELLEASALDALPLAKLQRAHVSTWNLSPSLAAKLGQRCPNTELLFEHRVEMDVEHDVDTLP